MARFAAHVPISSATSLRRRRLSRRRARNMADQAKPATGHSSEVHAALARGLRRIGKRESNLDMYRLAKKHEDAAKKLRQEE
jgi:hypothetical protein